MNRNELPDAFVVMYSVIDKTSLKTTEDELARLQNWDAIRSRTLIIVGNKIDLVRSRAVSTQGKLNVVWLATLFTFEQQYPSVKKRSSIVTLKFCQCLWCSFCLF